MTQEIQTADELKYQFQPAPNGVLNFSVRAANDAHIALTAGPEESDPMYEIFIGGWSNSKSVIRKNRTKPDVAEVRTPDILSANEFRKFWITWQNNTISVGEEGEPEPFLTFTDTESVPIGYYGICTGWGATGTWILQGVHDEVLTRDCGEFSTYKFFMVCQGHLEFSVKAKSDAQVAFASGPKETDPMYEIILGGWENTACAIRHRRGDISEIMDHRSSPGLLNAGEFRHFSIIWRSPDIRVEHNGQMILSLTDGPPFGVTHIGLCTGHGSTGTWRIHKVPVGFDMSSLYLRNMYSLPGGDKQSGVITEDEGEEELRETNKDNDDEAEGGDGEEAEEVTPEPSAPPASRLGPGNACWERRANGEIPEGAVEGGIDIESGEMIYVGRAEHEGAMLPGKFVPSHGVTYVAWGGGEHGKSEYEILCGCQATWVKCQDGEIPPNAFEGGQSEEGETLYIGRVNDGEKLALGKVQVSHKVCYIPYAGSELAYPEYEVLVAN